MLYFLIALGVAFASVLFPLFIGTLLSRGDSNKGTTITLGVVFSILYGLVLWFIMWKAAVGTYGPTPLFIQIFLGLIISLIIGILTRESFLPSLIPLIILLGSGFFIGFFGTSDIFNSTAKAKLLGDNLKVTTDIEEALEPADAAHICTVSESMARISANAALSKFKVSEGVVPGSRYYIGKATKQFVDGQLWWIFEVDFQGWLKWRMDKQIPGYLRVSAENYLQEPQAVQTNKNGEEIHIKYLNSACWQYRADRYLRNHGYMTSILHDCKFEPDDNWNPYYTIAVLERTIGYSGYKLKGVVTLNLQTGDVQFYSIDKRPKWIDRAMPIEVIAENSTNWGLYNQEGWWYNIWHNDKSQEPTPGWYLTYSLDGKCQWYSGFTSKTAGEHALTGFVLINSDTQQTFFYKAAGTTEAIAYDTALSMVRNFPEYEPTEMVPYNIYGILTYTIPIAFRGQFKGIALVSLRNKDINAYGETVEKALSLYRSALARSNRENEVPSSGFVDKMELKGIVELVGIPIVMPSEEIILFTMKGVNKIFQVSYSPFSTPKAGFLKEGINVVITYQDTKEKVISCETFDIPSIILSEENPAQARYRENQELIRQESDRVDKEEKTEKLLNSERMKNVDPKQLNDFLRNKAKK